MLSSAFGQYALWIAGPVLQSVLLVLLWRRGFVRKYWLFGAYLGVNSLRTVVLVGQTLQTGGNYVVYFYTYWFSHAIVIGLSFAVIYELFTHVFQPYEGLRNVGTLVFRIAALVMLGLAVLVAFGNTGSDTHRVLAGILLLERSVDIIRVGMVLFLFAVSSYLGLRLRDHAFGIALGFGIYSSVALAGVALRAHIGPDAGAAFSLAATIAFLCSILIWIAYVVSPAKQPATVPALPKTELEKWNRTLVELLNQ